MRQCTMPKHLCVQATHHIKAGIPNLALSLYVGACAEYHIGCKIPELTPSTSQHDRAQLAAMPQNDRTDQYGNLALSLY